MTIQFLGPLSRAWARMKSALFRPFDIHKWFVVGFNAFLAGLMGFGNGSGGARAGKKGDFADVLEFPRTAWDWLQAHPGWAVAILFGVVVAIAVGAALTWLSSRGVFMFLDSVVRDRAEIARPWREYRKESNSLFVWRLALGLVAFVAFGLALAYFFARGAVLFDRGVRPELPVPFLVGFGLIVLAGALVWGYLFLFLKDFVAPLMYKNRISCGQAWKLFLGPFRQYPFHFIGYGLVLFLLMIAFAAAVIVAGVFTCCIGWVLLAIPYVSTVVTLPVWYAYRAFSLEFLAQFGPEFDLTGRPAADAPPAAPAAPAV